MGYMKEQYNNYMIESANEWYAEQAELLVKHIDSINLESQKEMDNNPDLFIGMLTNDIHHWAEYGVHTVADLELYLEREYEREMRKESMY